MENTIEKLNHETIVQCRTYYHNQLQDESFFEKNPEKRHLYLSDTMINKLIDEIKTTKPFNERIFINLFPDHTYNTEPY